MSRYRKPPDAGCTANAKGSSNTLYPLYSASTLKTQARLINKHGVNRASAIFVADILVGGSDG